MWFTLVMSDPALSKLLLQKFTFVLVQTRIFYGERLPNENFVGCLRWHLHFSDHWILSAKDLDKHAGWTVECRTVVASFLRWRWSAPFSHRFLQSTLRSQQTSPTRRECGSSCLLIPLLATNPWRLIRFEEPERYQPPRIRLDRSAVEKSDTWWQVSEKIIHPPLFRMDQNSHLD
jgi:hypothetical protein